MVDQYILICYFRAVKNEHYYSFCTVYLERAVETVLAASDYHGIYPTLQKNASIIEIVMEQPNGGIFLGSC